MLSDCAKMLFILFLNFLTLTYKQLSRNMAMLTFALQVPNINIGK